VGSRLARRWFTFATVGVAVIGTFAATTAPSWATFPSASGRIAFASDGAGDPDIHTMNQDGSAMVNLTAAPGTPGFALEPDYSPDGTKIAFRSGPGDDAESYTVNATGGSPVQVTFGSGSDQFPQFSPDGTRIAYDSDGGGVSAIYTVKLSDLAVTKLTANVLRAGLADWSPDGTKIAFTTNWYACKKPRTAMATSM
jgi:Tol biopolymer transport system component